MCSNPCSACNRPPYQLSPHRSQPKASVIPSLKAQINVPSVFKLRRLNMEILLITARHVIVRFELQPECAIPLCMHVCVHISGFCIYLWSPPGKRMRLWGTSFIKEQKALSYLHTAQWTNPREQRLHCSNNNVFYLQPVKSSYQSPPHTHTHPWNYWTLSFGEGEGWFELDHREAVILL